MIQYTHTQIQKILNINRNTLQQWLNCGFVCASINRSSKQGDTNLFSEKDLICIKLFMYLNNQGFSRQLAAKIAKLRHHWAEDTFAFKDGPITMVIDMKEIKNLTSTCSGFADKAPQTTDV